MTWSDAAGRDRQTFSDLEDGICQIAPQAVEKIRAALLRAYDLGREDTIHEATVTTRKRGRITPCGCAECAHPA